MQETGGARGGGRDTDLVAALRLSPARRFAPRARATCLSRLRTLRLKVSGLGGSKEPGIFYNKSSKNLPPTGVGRGGGGGGWLRLEVENERITESLGRFFSFRIPSLPSPNASEFGCPLRFRLFESEIRFL